MQLLLSGNFDRDEKVRRYATRMIGSLEKYLPRVIRDTAAASVTLDTVNRPHGNKYEATVTVTAGNKTYAATDSTLNVFAALDIVSRQLALALKKDAGGRLPRARNRV